MSKQQFMIDVCKIDTTNSICKGDYKESFVIHYYENKTFKNKIIVQCTKVGECKHQKHAIMTIEEEIDD